MSFPGTRCICRHAPLDWAAPVRRTAASHRGTTAAPPSLIQVYTALLFSTSILEGGRRPGLRCCSDSPSLQRDGPVRLSHFFHYPLVRFWSCLIHLPASFHHLWPSSVSPSLPFGTLPPHFDSINTLLSSSLPPSLFSHLLSVSCFPSHFFLLSYSF